VDLDRVTSTSSVSAVNQSLWASESFDYNQGAATIDPPGYACTQTPLPTGSVVCRRVETGYVGPAGSTSRERHATFYSYDAKGQLVRTYGPVRIEPTTTADVIPVEERTYWADTALLQRRGRLMEVRQYASPTSAPLITSYDYDAFGVYRTVAPNGAPTTIVKDGRGRPSFVIGPDGSRTEMRYYDGLAPRLQIAPSGRAVRFAYDGKGRLASSEYLDRDPEAGPATVAWSEVRTYDGSGNALHTERRDAAGVVTWTQDREYDVQHRVVKEIHPEDASLARSYVYDTTGFLSSVTDEEGRATIFTPDVLRRVAKVRRTGFNAQGQPVGLDVAPSTYERQVDSISQVTDGASRPTTYSHDDFGRLQQFTNSISNYPPAYAYDARGNLLQRKSSYYGYYGEQIITQVDFAYDGLNRVTRMSARNGIDGASLTVTYRHDEPGGEGFLTSVAEPDRTIRFSYDLAGRLQRERIEENGVAAPLVTEYAYDADGDVEVITYPSGSRIRYVRDPATKRVTRVLDDTFGVAYADAVRALPAGPVTSLTFGNGLSLAQTYDARYQPSTIASGPFQVSYAMTRAGDVGTTTEGTTSRTFQYDFLDRLSASPGWLSYAYDGSGNRTSETVQGASASYSYVTGSELIKEKLGPGSVRQLALVHDRDSNVTGIARYDGTTAIGDGYCLRRDPLGRLDHVGVIAAAFINPSYNFYGCLTDDYFKSIAARFKYDFRKRRIARWLASTNKWTYVLSDAQGNPLSEIALVNGAWTPVRDYVWLDGRPLAQLEFPGPAGSARGYAYYYHLDHIGLPRALTNEAGQTVWTAAVRPYGDLVESATQDPLSGKTVVTNLRLPGQYDERLLGSLGLQGPYYNWNRWYLPGVGRYLELDPIAMMGAFNGEFGPDWYTYAGNNPLSYVDPDGRWPSWVKNYVFFAFQWWTHKMGPSPWPPPKPGVPPPPSCPVVGPPGPPPPPPPWWKGPPAPFLPIIINPCALDPRFCRGYQPDPFS
jgi:RHS repeat-associated protein